ncbi:hypothetical protein [Bifidobacterium actinocoloniiforme]|uniref:hypothetical protein n=1 Tax=Bifidobacterium actinocoloniiforme TaxID=638619 RepID=UPI0011873B54|nr:hypothetical protein [Bifidobacterium actinocoloniiforme]
MTSPSSDALARPLTRHAIRTAVHDQFDAPRSMSAWHAFDTWLRQVREQAWEEGRQAGQRSILPPNPYTPQT